MVRAGHLWTVIIVRKLGPKGIREKNVQHLAATLCYNSKKNNVLAESS